MTKDDLLSYIREKFNYPIGFFESDAVNAALKLYDIIKERDDIYLLHTGKNQSVKGEEQ